MSLANIPWGETLTALVALYGAILATVVAVREWKAGRPDIKVDVWQGPVYIREADDWTDSFVHIRARNRGRKAVNMTEVGIILRGDKRLPLSYSPEHLNWPYELLPEKSRSLMVEPIELAVMLKSEGFDQKVSFVGYWCDALGRLYTSKPAIFDMNAEKLAKSVTHPSD
jgi:hypothetical protein